MTQIEQCGRALRRYSYELNEEGLANIRAYTDKELAVLAAMPKRVTNPGALWSDKP